ncbi:MAG: inositol monophosphatase family protein [Candidatus Methylacidiphilales bacterium]
MTEADVFSSWLKLAIQVAREAGAKVRAAFGGDLIVDEAHAHDIKLRLDVETQALIEARLLGTFPDHSLLGEEGGAGSDGKGAEWIVDPIDGTVNLSYGIPHFCVSIGCRWHGVTQVGVIYDPMREELFTAIRGGGAFLNGRPMRVSSRSELAVAAISLGFSKSHETLVKCLDLYAFYGPRTRKLRAMGSAALDLAYIAAGRLDGYIEQGINLWDIAAGQLMVEEAGGKVNLTPRDKPHHFHIVASNGRISMPES